MGSTTFRKGTLEPLKSWQSGATPPASFVSNLKTPGSSAKGGWGSHPLAHGDGPKSGLPLWWGWSAASGPPVSPNYAPVSPSFAPVSVSYAGSGTHGNPASWAGWSSSWGCVPSGNGHPWLTGGLYSGSTPSQLGHDATDGDSACSLQ